MKKLILILIAALIFVGILLFLRTTRSADVCVGYNVGNNKSECVKNCRNAGCEHGYADGTSKCEAHCSNIYG